MQALGRDRQSLAPVIRALIWAGGLLLVFGTVGVVIVALVGYDRAAYDGDFVGQAARVGEGLIWLEPMVIAASVALWILAALLVLIGQRDSIAN
jgi:hypothetical protein